MTRPALLSTYHPHHHRRTTLRIATTTAGLAALLVLAACATPTAGGSGNADEFPTGNLTMIVSFDPGGSSDTQARLMADYLEDELDTTITVENRPGAGGQVGYTALAGSEADGATFGLVSIPGILMSVLDESRGAEYTLEDFQPIASQVLDPTVLVVAPDSPYETVEDLVDAAKAAPGTIKTTTTGIGSQDHLALLELERVADIDLQTVHFADGASAAATAFLGGNNVDVLIGNVSDATSLVANGTGRVLGVMADERSPFLEDVPTFAESGYDVSIATLRGYAYPAGVDDAITERMSDAIGAVVDDEEFQQRMTDLGADPVYYDTAEYEQQWTDLTETFRTLLPAVRDDA